MDIKHTYFAHTRLYKMYVCYVAVFLAFTLLCLLNQSACLCGIHYFSFIQKHAFIKIAQYKFRQFFLTIFDTYEAPLYLKKSYSTPSNIHFLKTWTFS